ncbi:MAG TPA: lipopolysaccharide heptosyltransferase II [Candidatus Cloacimonetes bacterium]|nr:lipopolysaccharide heptosyltransferase II [Candidatus Cloacimonadota bacterium]
MRILIIHTAFIGDIILITPLIKYTKQVFPKAAVDVLVIPQTRGILQNNPYLKKILVFDKRKNKIAHFLQTISNLKRRNYEIVFLPHSSLTTALLAFFSGIKIRIGFDRWLAAKFLTKKIPFYKGKHRIEKNLDLLKAFSNRKYDIQTELFPSKNDIEKAGKFLSKVNQRRKRIAIAPGSVWQTKCWSESYYKILAERLVEKGFSIIMTGSSEERELCQRILPKKNAINLAGQTSILESAAILEKCDLLVCNDSGALHLANAMKTDVFAIFGPTVKNIGYYPIRENDFVFEHDLDCRPCGSHGGKKCPLDHHNCMKLIEPEMILEKICSRFKEGSLR